MMNVLDFFSMYLGNWIVLSMIGCVYFLLLKTFSKPIYNRLFNSFKFQLPYLYLSFMGLFVICFREVMLYPWNLVASWMPGGYAWEILIMFLGTTHLISISMYSCLIYYLWKKFDNMIPALLIGFLCIGFIEFTFIPQHLLAYGMFLGWNWYSGFAIILIPFIVEWKRFKIGNIEKFTLFIAAAIILEYVILIWLPFSLAQFEPSLMAWRINEALQPHPPLETWLFQIVQWFLKTFFILGFAQIDLKRSC